MEEQHGQDGDAAQPLQIRPEGIARPALGNLDQLVVPLLSDAEAQPASRFSPPCLNRIRVQWLHSR